MRERLQEEAQKEEWGSRWRREEREILLLEMEMKAKKDERWKSVG